MECRKTTSISVAYLSTWLKVADDFNRLLSEAMSQKTPRCLRLIARSDSVDVSVVHVEDFDISSVRDLHEGEYVESSVAKASTHISALADVQ